MKEWQVKIIDHVAAETWTELALERAVFQDKFWFDAAPHPGKLVLIGAFNLEKLAVMLPVFIVEKPGHYFHNPAEILGLPNENCFPCAISVSPFGYRGGVICRQPQHVPSFVYDEIINAARDVFIQANVRIAAHYYLNKNDDDVWMNALKWAGIGTHVVGADCNLEVTWNSMDEFFQSLGAHRKSRMRAEFRKLAANRQWRKRTELRTDEVDVVAGLFANTQRKYHHEINWHRNLLQEFSEERFLLTGESEGRINSALLVFRKNNVLYPKFYGDNNIRGDYFLLCYYLLIAEAIQTGATRIEFGGGSHKAKLLRGASLRPLFMGIEVFDQQLASLLEGHLPVYEKNKKDHFASMRDQYNLRKNRYEFL